MTKPVPDIVIRGIRQTVPPGYLIGRVGSTAGPAQLISIAQLGAALKASGQIATAPTAANLEFLGFLGQGPFVSQDQYKLAPSPRAVTFPSVTALATQNKATCTTAPTADFTVVLTNNLTQYLANGSNIICSVKFLAGQFTGTFTYGASTLVPSGSYPYIVMPAATDATIAGILLQFAGDAS